MPIDGKALHQMPQAQWFEEYGAQGHAIYMYQRLDTGLVTSAAYHAQTDGQYEKTNQRNLPLPAESYTGSDVLNSIISFRNSILRIQRGASFGAVFPPLAWRNRPKIHSLNITLNNQITAASINQISNRGTAPQIGFVSIWSNKLPVGTRCLRLRYKLHYQSWLSWEEIRPHSLIRHWHPT